MGATCAALALAVTAGLCVRRRRQQQHAQRKHDAAAQAAASCDASASSCGMLETEDKASWAGQSAAFTLVSGRSPSPALSLGLGSSSGAVTASTLGSLPLGPSSTGSVRQLVVGGKACPPAPPPSAANSMALNSKLGHGTVPGEQVLASAAAPQPPRASNRVAAQPAASPRAAAVAAEAAAAAGHSLLSQLPTYGWQRCLVDYAAIEFVLDEEGLPVELGAGASATVSFDCISRSGSCGAAARCGRELAPIGLEFCFTTCAMCVGQQQGFCQISASILFPSQHFPYLPLSSLPRSAGVPGAAERRGAARSQGVPPGLQPPGPAGVSGGGQPAAPAAPPRRRGLCGRVCGQGARHHPHGELPGGGCSPEQGRGIAREQGRGSPMSSGGGSLVSRAGGLQVSRGRRTRLRAVLAQP